MNDWSLCVLTLSFCLASFIFLNDPLLGNQDYTKERSRNFDEQFANEQDDRYLPSSATVQSNNCYDDPANGWDLWIYPHYFYLGYTGGRGLGYKKGYTTLGLFSAPSSLASSRLQPFFDAKGYVFNDGKWGGSAGLGTRYIFSSKNIVLGYHVYYDYKRFHQFDLNQVGIGLELLSPYWDLRINGYIPVGTKNFHRLTLFDFSGGFIAVRDRRVTTWYGVDSEIGTWLKRKFSCDWFGIYFAGGPYYYTRNHERRFERGAHHHAYGGRARLLARICDFIDVSVIATYDSVWHTRVQGQITLAIPFDCGAIIRKCTNRCDCISSPCLLNQIAIQPVQRNGIIVADPKCFWLWNWSDGSSGDSSSHYSSHSYDDSSGYHPAHSIGLSSIDSFSSSFFDHSSTCSGGYCN